MRTVGPPRVLNIADLRRVAKLRLPRVVFDYIDGGAEQELTMRQNVGAYDVITFQPRCAVAIPHCDLRTTVLGTPLELPFLLAPVSGCRMFYPRGEVVAAEAASARNGAYIQPTLSGCNRGGRIERRSGQLYRWRSRCATAGIAS
jgi:L-lactate dehydrogenase (cytochrome)